MTDDFGWLLAKGASIFSVFAGLFIGIFYHSLYSFPLFIFGIILFIVSHYFQNKKQLTKLEKVVLTISLIFMLVIVSIVIWAIFSLKGSF